MQRQPGVPYFSDEADNEWSIVQAMNETPVLESNHPFPHSVCNDAVSYTNEQFRNTAVIEPFDPNEDTVSDDDTPLNAEHVVSIDTFINSIYRNSRRTRELTRDQTRKAKDSILDYLHTKGIGFDECPVRLK